MNPITIRTMRTAVGGQSSSSYVPSVIKTNVLLNNDDPAHKEFLLRKYRKRIEKLSQQDKLIKFCTDAGVLNVVEVGQYFMTKDTEEFSQFTESVTCREYTLPRDENLSEPKGWIRGNNQNFGSYWKLQPAACEIRLVSRVATSSSDQEIVKKKADELVAWRLDLASRWGRMALTCSCKW